jgi:hypothetical protein
LTAAIRPRPLPKLALRHGIPARDRTIVAVPSIIDSPARIESLFHDLEVRFLANRDPHLHFALLSDFPDAATQTHAGDDGLVHTARFPQWHSQSLTGPKMRSQNRPSRSGLNDL